jgi:hypothetical protein
LKEVVCFGKSICNLSLEIALKMNSKTGIGNQAKIANNAGMCTTFPDRGQKLGMVYFITKMRIKN